MSPKAYSPKIAVFGHYGNQNLGDEAIIEATIKNIRHHEPNADILCFSINPLDSSIRHGLEAFPIRYRKDFFEKSSPPYSGEAGVGQSPNTPSRPTNASKAGIKQTLKSIPILGSLLKLAVSVVDRLAAIRQEISYLKEVKQRLTDIDLLLITGSNQFLDNFGGPWGFPYTLMKWTLLAKRGKTKVAFISIGAGPLTHPLSFFFLNLALKRADYLSYRDEGSKALIESKIRIDAPVYPDIAHSLGAETSRPNSHSNNTESLSVAINPMPVYDKRYWHEPNEEKFQDYVNKVQALCYTALNQGHKVTLFSTQLKDQDVIDDIVRNLEELEISDNDLLRLNIEKCHQVQELIEVINKADVIVATRFHATVLPLQLSKPTLGICYYRKAAELLREFGMKEYVIEIDNFTKEELVQKFNTLVKNKDCIPTIIAAKFSKYSEELEEQYRRVFELLN